MKLTKRQREIIDWLNDGNGASTIASPPGYIKVIKPEMNRLSRLGFHFFSDSDGLRAGDPPLIWYCQDDDIEHNKKLLEEVEGEYK